VKLNIMAYFGCNPGEFAQTSMWAAVSTCAAATRAKEAA
jgi:hypothetical protein